MTLVKALFTFDAFFIIFSLLFFTFLVHLSIKRVKKTTNYSKSSIMAKDYKYLLKCMTVSLRFDVWNCVSMKVWSEHITQLLIGLDEIIKDLVRTNHKRTNNSNEIWIRKKQKRQQKALRYWITSVIAGAVNSTTRFFLSYE